MPQARKFLQMHEDIATEINISQFNNLALGVKMLLRINVFSALVIFIVEVGASVLPDCNCICCIINIDRIPCMFHPKTKKVLHL